MIAPVAELPTGFRPLTVVEYERMIEVGILTEDDRVELVGGVLVDRPAPGPEHTGIHIRLTTRLAQASGDAFFVSAQNGLIVDEISMPQPDLAVIAARDFHGLTASPDEAVLVIEIAKTSLRFDLGEKRRRYAMRGFAEYWVVDVDARQILVHRDARDEGVWSTVLTVASGPLAVRAAPSLEIHVGDLFA